VPAHTSRTLQSLISRDLARLGAGRCCTAVRRLLTPALSLLLALPAFVAAQAVASVGTVPLRLRPGDALRLEIRDEPQMRGDYPVDVEGLSLLPLVGLVPVAGRPFDQVRRDVLAAYGRELAEASERVRVTPVMRIAVIGEVMRPGLVPVDPSFALADVLASAGGVTPFANRKSISLMREGQPVLVTTIDDIGAVRVAIQSGDQLFVRRRSWVQDNMPILVGGGVSVLATLLTALILR
jgi:polysaccharide export outer membrane protein